MARVALITGSSGGIGQAVVAAFRDAGWRTIGVDLSESAAAPQPDRFIQADIGLPQAVTEIIDSVRDTEGRLDALVNNAATQVCKPLIDTSLEEWDRTMTVNLRAPFLLVRAAHELLSASKGAIVNVSSVHAVATSAGIGAYAASKSALLSLTRSLALELGGKGVRVNAVLPGAVDTQMLAASQGRGNVSAGGVRDKRDELAKKHALGRVGAPAEIAQSILFLCSHEQASFMTGQGIIVDGGATARLSTE